MNLFSTLKMQSNQTRSTADVKLYFAPLEGITGYVFRNAHARYFPGTDKYFAPFISTNQNHKFTNKEMRDILPDNNRGANVVPQLLGKVAEDFIAAAVVLRDMGYDEVNLNLGCPSGTVTAKGKGAGMLANPEQLDRFLDEIFEGCDISISLKTRLGIEREEEFDEILQIYNRYPIAELTIHPRVQKDFYKNNVRLDAFSRAAEQCRAPVCYNGDIRTESGCADITGRFPRVQALMLGRGLVADPSLVSRMRGGAAADRDTLRAFHDDIYEGYRRDFGNDRNAMMRMKELWSHLITLFEDSGGYGKKLGKAASPAEFDALVQSVFTGLALRRE